MNNYNKYEEMGKANIRAYCEKLKERILDYALDTSGNIKCEIVLTIINDLEKR